MSSDINNYESKKYNYIYQELVDNDNDLVGMIAYALYKNEKIKYIKKITEESGSISDTQIDNYNTSSMIRIDDYENKAINLFTEFINTIIDKKVRLSEELIKEVVEKTASPKGFVNWARVITQNIISAFIYTVIIGSILLYVWFMNSGEKLKTENMVKNKIKELIITTPSTAE